MFPVKKIKQGTGKEENRPIDVSWLLFIGAAKLGYSEKEVYLMQMGKWLDLFDTYRRVYNFETARQLYSVEEAGKKDSVMNL